MLKALYDLDRHQQFGKMLELLRKLEIEAPDSMVYHNLGLTQMKIGRLAEAEAALRTSIQYDAKNAHAHAVLAMLLVLRADLRAQDRDGAAPARKLLEQSLAEADAALAANDKLAIAHVMRGRALSRLGDGDAAVAALRQAVLIAPEMADAHVELGEALGKRGQLHDAVQALENAVRVAPDHTTAQKSLEKWRARLDELP
jgi:Flp pilus assembly protein TadD